MDILDVNIHNYTNVVIRSIFRYVAFQLATPRRTEKQNHLHRVILYIYYLHIPFLVVALFYTGNNSLLAVYLRQHPYSAIAVGQSTAAYHIVLALFPALPALSYPR
jgi:hypothetical protein